jgi:hypothetical protein
VREGLGFNKIKKKHKKSPKLHFGVNKKNLNLLFHFHILNMLFDDFELEAYFFKKKVVI